MCLPWNPVRAISAKTTTIAEITYHKIVKISDDYNKISSALLAIFYSNVSNVK